MKKFLPILSLITIPTLLCACNDDKEKANISFDGYKANISNFQKYLQEYSTMGEQHLNKLTLNKYRLSLDLPDTIQTVNTEAETEQEPATSEFARDTQTADNNKITTLEMPTENGTKNSENTKSSVENDPTKALDEQQPTVLPDTSERKPVITDQPNANTSSISNEKISTLYSLTKDVDSECDAFCTLKQNLNDAISETQNLINKINDNQLTLTNEQRMFLTEQSWQLKSLGRQLAASTTELGLSLTDLSTSIDGKANVDQLAMKYLIVLNNLAAGNEMLENSLYTLNMVNSLMRMPNTIPGNNAGRILYGFRQNDNPPVIYDYLIDKNGNLVNNTDANEAQTDNKTANETDENATNDSEKDKNLDEQNKNDADTNTTKPRPFLTPNIDTYGNFRGNIDTFYNTALLDRYAYNRGGYGFGGYGGFGNYGANGLNGYNMNAFGGFNPYMAYNQNPTNTLNPNTTNTTDSVETSTNGVETINNTQDKVQSGTNKKQPRFKLTKNIDTYRDADTPTIKQKFASIKNSINSFFAKFKKPNKDDIKNPIYRMEHEGEQSTNNK